MNLIWVALQLAHKVVDVILGLPSYNIIRSRKWNEIVIVKYCDFVSAIGRVSIKTTKARLVILVSYNRNLNSVAKVKLGLNRIVGRAMCVKL